MDARPQNQNAATPAHPSPQGKTEKQHAHKAGDADDELTVSLDELKDAKAKVGDVPIRRQCPPMYRADHGLVNTGRKALVVYSFTSNDNAYHRQVEVDNYAFFRRHAMLPPKTPTALFSSVDYVVARVNLTRFVNGSTLAEGADKNDVQGPPTPDLSGEDAYDYGIIECSRHENVRVFEAPLGPCDLCASARIIAYFGGPAALSAEYEFVVFVNSGVRGPFFTETAPPPEGGSPVTWLDHIALGGEDLYTGRVASGASASGQYRPHMQTHAFAMPTSALAAVQPVLSAGCMTEGLPRLWRALVLSFSVDLHTINTLSERDLRTLAATSEQQTRAPKPPGEKRHSGQSGADDDDEAEHKPLSAQEKNRRMQEEVGILVSQPTAPSGPPSSPPSSSVEREVAAGDKRASAALQRGATSSLLQNCVACVPMDIVKELMRRRPGRPPPKQIAWRGKKRPVCPKMCGSTRPVHEAFLPVEKQIVLVSRHSSFQDQFKNQSKYKCIIRSELQLMKSLLTATRPKTSTARRDTAQRSLPKYGPRVGSGAAHRLSPELQPFDHTTGFFVRSLAHNRTMVSLAQAYTVLHDSKYGLVTNPVTSALLDVCSAVLLKFGGDPWRGQWFAKELVADVQALSVTQPAPRRHAHASLGGDLHDIMECPMQRGS